MIHWGIQGLMSQTPGRHAWGSDRRPVSDESNGEGVSITSVDRYEIQTGDRLAGKIVNGGTEQIAVVRTDGTAVLVPPAGLIYAGSTSPTVSAAPTAPPLPAPPPPAAAAKLTDSAKKAKIAFWSGVALSVLTTGSAIGIGVIATRLQTKQAAGRAPDFNLDGIMDEIDRIAAGDGTAESVDSTGWKVDPETQTED